MIVNTLIFPTINNFKRLYIWVKQCNSFPSKDLSYKSRSRWIVHNRFGKKKIRHSIFPTANRPKSSDYPRYYSPKNSRQEERKESWERRRSFSTLASWSIPVMIKRNEVSDTMQQREKKGEKETFRRISLPPRMVNSISLPFSRGNVLDPMGTEPKIRGFVRV